MSNAEITREIDYTTGGFVYYVGRTRYLTQADAEAAVEAITARAAARKALADAYLAAGFEIRVTIDGLTRAAAMRGARRYAVVSVDTGETVAVYDSIDAIPALEDEAAEVVADAESVAAVAAEAAALPARPAGPTSYRPGAGYVVADGGRSQIFDHS